MKLLQDIRLPIGLEPDWRSAFMEELDAAESGLPHLSLAALELAELAVNGQYDAEVVGSVLERDDHLRDQVLRMANSAVYAAESRIESTAQAAQRIGMRALWEIAVVDVARSKVFGPALGHVLGGTRMWSIARLAGAVSHRLSARKLGKARASILAGLILCVGPPLAHQLIRRVEEKRGNTIPPRIRRELSNRVSPNLSVALVQAWALSDSMLSAANSFADGRGDMPSDTEAQIAVFSVSFARFLTAGSSTSLRVPLRWPTAVALELTEADLREIVEAAASIDDEGLAA